MGARRRREDVPIVTEVGGYVTVGYAAELLGVQRQRIHQLVDEGKIEALRVTDSATQAKAALLLVKTASIEAYREAREDVPRRGPVRGTGGRPRKEEGEATRDVEG